MNNASAPRFTRLNRHIGLALSIVLWAAIAVAVQALGLTISAKVKPLAASPLTNPRIAQRMRESLAVNAKCSRRSNIDSVG